MRENMLENGRKNGELVIYFAVAIWFASEILVNSEIETIMLMNKAVFNRTVTVIISFMLITKIVTFQDYTKRELILVSFLTVFIFAATINSGNNIMMSTWLFIVASKNIEIDRIIQLSYCILIILIVFVIVLNKGGIIGEKLAYSHGMVRHSLGFSHPNWLGMRLFQLGITHIYLRNKNIRFVEIIAIIVLAYFIYRVPNCQTAYYALILSIFFLGIKRLFEMFENGDGVYAKCLTIIAIVVNLSSVLLSIVDVRNNAFLRLVDDFLSYRFSSCHRIYKHYGITLCGQKIDMYKKIMNRLVHAYYLDTAFTTILLRYGIIVYLAFSTLYLSAMIYAYKKRHFFLVFVLFIYAIYGIMENAFFSLAQNIYLIALAAPIYNSDLRYNSLEGTENGYRYRIIFGSK